MEVSRQGAQIGVSYVNVIAHAAGACGPTGLPLTPNALRFAGALRALPQPHPHCARYLHCKPAVHSDRVFIAAEHYTTDLNSLLGDKPVDSALLRRIAFEILQALTALNEINIICRNISSSTVLLTADLHVKLANYALFHASEAGKIVHFPVGTPRYMSPELIISGACAGSQASNTKEDVWALGVLVLELLLGRHMEQSSLEGSHRVDCRKVFAHTIQFAQRHLSDETIVAVPQTDLDYLMEFVADSKATARLASYPADILNFARLCLECCNRRRPTPAGLMEHAMIASVRRSAGVQLDEAAQQTSRLSFLRCANLDLSTIPSAPQRSSIHSLDDSTNTLIQLSPAPSAVDRTSSVLSQTPAALASSPLHDRDLLEIFELWSIAGGDLEQEFVKKAYIQIRPPVLYLPTLVRQSRQDLDEETEQGSRDVYSTTIRLLDLNPLHNRLHQAHIVKYPRLFQFSDSNALSYRKHHFEGEELALMIRERDIDYQANRIAYMARLLRGYPFTKAQILEEAKIDIPPFLRGQIWGALLGITQEVVDRYATIEKDSETSTDRQIDVDIPRCHQYDFLMSSPAGHLKLRRVLKAWVADQTELVYWQGLDSLCAPFIRLNFNDEAFAWACASTFINRFLNNFFLKDNSLVMQEFLLVFSHMIAYHDAALAHHLNTTGFIPELYAIPWFLTCFAHVFPLHQLYYVWDRLLLFNSSLTICVGVSILMMLRDTILTSQFNECIMLFTDSPDVDIEICMQKATQMFLETPPSVTARKHGSSEVDTPLQDYDFPSIPTLRNNVVPFLSVPDFLTLYNYGKEDGATTRKIMRIITIDIRPLAEFDAYHMPYSASYPSDDPLFEDEQCLRDTFSRFASRPAADGRRLVEKHICIIRPENLEREAIQLSSRLLELSINRVSILLGGCEALQRRGLLASSSQEDIIQMRPATAQVPVQTGRK
eukprot:m.364098 g.364098  ORF g.364098 m.364098 type:complete len:944 (+) comp56035_c0_seq4:1-2832(+)